MPRTIRRRVAGLALLIVGWGTLVLASPGSAQEPEGPDDAAETEQTTTTAAPGATEAVAGQLVVDVEGENEPVEDVSITVADAAGNEVATVTSDSEGGWSVPVPGPGAYTVTLDEDTLPDGVTIREGLSAEATRNVQPGRTAQTAFPLVGEDSDSGGAGGGASQRTFTDKLAQSLVNGIKFGLIIAMTAIGLSLIFGTTGLVNFAHAELVTFGAIAAWFLNTAGVNIGPLSPDVSIGPWEPFNPMHLVVAAVLAVGLGALVGGAIDLGVFRPLRQRRTGSFQMLVISIGLSLALRQLLLIWFGESSHRYRNYAIQSTIDIGPVAITPRDLWIMGLSAVTLVGVGLVLQYTRIGRATRAVADNQDLAESSGVDVQRVILFVWMAGAGLAALGGVFQSATGSVNYLNGFQMLLLMFAGIILGGLGTAFGAVVGSIVVGLATELSTVWLSSELKYVWALVVLAAVLLIRPQGLLGVKERVG